MKSKFYLPACFLFIVSIIHAQNKTTTMQYANKSLSNLTSPAINTSLVPDKNNNHNIGNSTKAWRNLYLDSAVYLNGNKFISTSRFTNIFIGYLVGFANTTGLDNTATGYDALASNITGNQNTVTGMFALSTGTNSFSNTANGYAAMEYGDGGESNTSIGSFTLTNNYGNANTALGNAALIYNMGGSYNVAVGTHALSNSIDGDHLVAVGDSALYNLNGGAGHCTAVGSQAGINNTTGSDNIFLGYHAGNNVTDGSQNTFLGSFANCGSGPHIINSTAIGYQATVVSSNHVHIGNPSVTSIGGQVGWSQFSDERIKNNIQQNVPGLQFINLLKPVTYHLDLNKQENIAGGKDSSDYDGKYDIQKIQFTGFLAQDVEAAAKKINYDFSGIDKPKNDKDLYGLRYSDFVVPLVKAVQELSKQNDSLNLKINQLQNLKTENEELKSRIELIEQKLDISSTAQTSTNIVLNNEILSQNTPNPFSNSTTINYSLPKQFSSAKIIITDKNGNALKIVTLSNNKGSVNIDAATLSSGAYQYSLYVDEKLIATKQMEHIK